MKINTENYLFLFGGCYSNFQATKRVKEIAEEMGFSPNQVYCTGDIVGYCAQPEETVELIKEWGVHSIAGNVEIQLRDGVSDCGCNFEEGSRCDVFSAQWYPYAQKHLSIDSINWMKTLPENISFHLNQKSIHILHGGPEDISEFIFSSTPISRKLEIFEKTKSDIIIAGHSGLPFVQSIKTKTGEKKLWINAGVIGMPANDGTTRCWFALLNTENFNVELHSFEYDHNLASQLMLENGLTKEYASTLLTGIWDNCEILPEIETKIQGFEIKSR